VAERQTDNSLTQNRKEIRPTSNVVGNNLFHCLQVSVGATSDRAVFPEGFQNQIACTTREELNWAVFKLCGQKFIFLSKIIQTNK